MATFSEMKTALDEISASITRNRKLMTQCESNAIVAETALTQLQTDYSAMVTEINDFLTANPNDEAAKTLKAEKDLLVAEFLALKTAATALKTAIQGVSF